MIGQNIGVIQRRFKVLGSPLGKTTTAIRLAGGQVLVHSAGPLTKVDLQDIRNLGEVKWLMEGNRLHDTFARRLRASFPDADYGVPDGFPIPRDEIAPAFPLSEIPEAWAEEVHVIPVEGMSRLQEHALVHRPSRTLVLADLVFNLAIPPGEKIPFFLRWVSGFRAFPGTSRLVKLCVQDRAAVSKSLARILAEDFDQIVLGHGEIIRDDAKTVLHELLSWGLKDA